MKTSPKLVVVWSGEATCLKTLKIPPSSVTHWGTVILPAWSFSLSWHAEVLWVLSRKYPSSVAVFLCSNTTPTRSQEWAAVGTDSSQRGRPKITVDLANVQVLRDLGFSWKKMCKQSGVSASAMKRKVSKKPSLQTNFTEITEEARLRECSLIERLKISFLRSTNCYWNVKGQRNTSPKRKSANHSPTNWSYRCSLQ